MSMCVYHCANDELETDIGRANRMWLMAHRLCLGERDLCAIVSICCEFADFLRWEEAMALLHSPRPEPSMAAARKASTPMSPSSG